MANRQRSDIEAVSEWYQSDTTETAIWQIVYQRIWYDYDVRDGSYTPSELRQAKMVVKQGRVLRYALTWPGGTPEPPRAEENAIIQMERWHKWRKWRGLRSGQTQS